MDQAIKDRVQSMIQSRIDSFHTTKARGYTSTTPNGIDIQRIGMSVYLPSELIDPAKPELGTEGDKQVAGIAKVLAQLSVEGKAGHPSPILVNVDGTDFVVVGSQISDEENNYSKRPKVIIADHLLGSNAEVSQDEISKSIRLQQEMRESSKNLKSQHAEVKKQLQSVSEEEFDELLS